MSHFHLSCSCWWQACWRTLVWSPWSGKFNPCPLQPKYLFAWDVQVALNLIKSAWDETDRLEGKRLSLKLLMLLALTTSSRASGIHHFHFRFLVNIGCNVTLHFNKLHKSWRKWKRPTVYAYSLINNLGI